MPQTRPAGSGEYVVTEGECLNTVARRFGFFWETIWNDPQNAEVRRLRKDHNILLPGDRLHIPELRQKSLGRASDQRHKFVRKGVPSLLKLRLLEDGSPEPYANQRYVLTVDGKHHQGTVDKDGYLQVEIDPGAQSATLKVGDGDKAEVFEIDISALDPIDSASGAQQRLRNLGLFAGDPADEWTPSALDALRQFQAVFVIKPGEQPSGEYDEATMAKLKETYGC